MRVKLVWIKQDFRGNHLYKREELLEGESAKNLTRNDVARLIARHHPELQFAGGTMLLDALEEPYKWYVKAIKQESDRWEYVYAELVDEPAGKGCIGKNRQPLSMLTVNRILQIILGVFVVAAADYGLSNTAVGFGGIVAFVCLIGWLIVDIFWPDLSRTPWDEV